MVAVGTTGAAASPTPTAAGITSAAPTGATPEPTRTEPTRTESAGASTAAVAATKEITYRQAAAIAVKRLPGARVTKAEREVEHGHRVWEVDLVKGGVVYDISVSVETGSIVRFRQDRDDRAARAGHDVGDDHGGDRVRDDRAGHDVGDDHGGDRVRDDRVGHDVGDDHGGDRRRH
ncbi:hypothetical protein Pth03_81050 [Planotetraspora thailandica]|uniref:PepSY domain-containing protein n=1 Tax=Planotetraspora thailandica TaxID=487172 RepID=A0A8J4DFV3_9ACTN|nr:hypothetical protein Pth03_81050 [Planotetraspora thailandica]